MTFVSATKTCFRKYFTFSGRAPRSEYWWFVLFTFVGALVVGYVDYALFGAGTVELSSGYASYEADGPLASLFSLAILIPMLAVGWRRMHDTGRSGFYLFYPLIVMIGIGMAFTFFGGLGAFRGAAVEGLAAIVLIPAMIVLAISPLLVLWWLTRPSAPGTNAYGPNPYEAQS